MSNGTWETCRQSIRCVLGVLSCALFVSQASAGFKGAHSFPGGPTVLTGDFNGDGVPDLLVQSAFSVGIMLGNGDGTFQPPTDYRVNPGLIALGDFNGDGHIDIVTSSGFILLGNGEGTFQPAQSYGYSGSSIAVADFNRDGKLDVALTIWSVAAQQVAVSILLGNGDGTFQSSLNLHAGDNPEALVVGDFNGDGIPDLAVANGPEGLDLYQGISVALGRGDGTFGSFSTYAAHVYVRPLAVGDFNGDGFQDLILANGSAAYILLANSDGTFQDARSIAGGAWSVAVGDFNSDGHLDLAWLVPSGMSIELGNGDGTFQEVLLSYAAAGGPTCLVAADFNGDGRLDIAVGGELLGDQGGVVTILMNDGDGTFRAAREFPNGAGSQSVAVGDLNGDGKADIVTANFAYLLRGRYPPYYLDIIESDVEVLLGNGDGTFQPAQAYKTGGAPLAVVLGDLNGDGIPDLAAANGGVEEYMGSPDNTVGILLGNGDGTFQPAQTFVVGPGPFCLAVGDFNGDGRLDIAAADSSGISILLGKGDGTFLPAQTYAAQTGSLVIADFNRDGHLDIATSGGSLLLGKGDGTFESPQTFAGSGATCLAVADFNGDTIPDLVLAYAGGTVVILLGNGDGTFQTAQSYGAGLQPLSVTVADFNRDGYLDFAVTDAISGTVTVFLGKGAGSFQAGLTYAAGGHPYSVAAGDLNGDGFPDLAVANYFPLGTLAVLLNAADWGGN